jgi:hypothetical protein
MPALRLVGTFLTGYKESVSIHQCPTCKDIYIQFRDDKKIAFCPKCE